MELSRRVEELENSNALLRHELLSNSLINNLAELMYSADDVDEILNIILFSLPEIVSFQRVIFFTIDRKNFSLKPAKSTGFTEQKLEDIVVSLGFLGGDLADAIFLDQHIVVENGIEEGDELAYRLASDSYMVVPISSRNAQSRFQKRLQKESFRTEDDRRKAAIQQEDFPTIGAFWFDQSEMDRQLTGTDVAIVTQLIHTAGIVIDNIRMMKRLQDVNENILSELDQARKVQESLLPSSLPKTDKLNVAVYYNPEVKVGGDYYDIFPLDEGLYGILIADVSGHGASAALVMAMTKVLIKSFSQKSVSPSETFEKVNEAMVKYATTNKFVTSFYAILDTNANQMIYTSAGHCTILLIDKESSSVFKIKSDGFFIGMFPELQLEDHKRDFSSGNNRMILYTDGVTEAMNMENAQYGTHRLATIAKKHVSLTPEDALEKMEEHLYTFMGGRTHDDDVTLIVLDF